MDSEFTTELLLAALERSVELDDLIRAAWGSSPALLENRARAVQGLCAVSLHHGSAARSLISTVPASAIALVRPQYESLVRSVWAAHAASESELGRLLAPLTAETQQAAKKLPGVPEMLAALEKSGPRGAAALLGRARSRLGDGLNSFVHGGIHPLARQRDGYPIGLLIDVLKNINALSILTIIQLATLPEQGRVSDALGGLHNSFQDVLPTLEPLTI